MLMQIIIGLNNLTPFMKALQIAKLRFSKLYLSMSWILMQPEKMV